MPRSHKNCSQTNENKKYSNAFQIHEQRQLFQGIDTYNVTSVGNFVYCSVLLDASESRTIICRPDTNAFIEKIHREKFLTTDSVNARRERANKVYPDPKFFEKYFGGSTYVTLDDAMLTQKMFVLKNWL